MALQQVGPYRILSELGRGAFGAVFLAQREGLERRVALKVLLPGADEVAQARFKQEAKLASQLEHPHIVRCCDLGRDPERGLLYLALDYVEGGSLKDRLREAGALEPREAARLVVQVCRGLDYAHRAGVLHRDLKPDNVLLRAGGLGQGPDALLTDFGLAKDLSAGGLTAEGIVIGTPNYFAPETLDGGPATAASDVYGAGLLLYECLCAQRTFPGNDFYTVTNAIRSGNYRPLKSVTPQVPRDLARIAQRACSLDPTLRYASAAELGRALEGFLSGPKASSDHGIPAFTGGGRGLPAWQLGLLFVALFLLAGAGTALALVLLDQRTRVAKGPPPNTSPAEKIPDTLGSPSPSRAPTPLRSPLATPVPRPRRDRFPTLEPYPSRRAEPSPRATAPIEGASEAELQARANRGEAAAAEALAVRALADWDHDAGRKWAALAGSARADLLERVRRAEDAERRERDPLREALGALESPTRLLPKVRAALEAHPRAPRLRTLEGQLLLWLGRPRAALAALERGAVGKYAVAIRGVANEATRLGVEDTAPEAPLHETWDSYRGGSWSWSPDDKTLEGRGRGLGPFGLSGVLERSDPRAGSFEAEVEVHFDRKTPDRYGGLMILSDAQNGLLIYLYHGVQSVPPQHREQVAAIEGGATLLRVAYLIRGEWRPFTDDQVFPFNPAGWHRLQASVSEGRTLQVSVDGRAAHPVKLPVEAKGRLGVLKWYEHALSYRGYRSGP